MDVEGQPDSNPESFTQWVADNVDHNVATLDGFGTFHGMGMISLTTQSCPSATAAESVVCGKFSETPVKRLPRTTVDTIARAKAVKIHYFAPPNISALSKIHFQPVQKLCYPYTQAAVMNFDLLWHVGWYFRGESEPRPMWSGFMQNVMVGDLQMFISCQS